MRVFAVSDIHVDYATNMDWVTELSRVDFQSDIVLVAGDLSHKPSLISRCLDYLQERFAQVLFVPGNHDLWLDRKDRENGIDSLDKYRLLRTRLNKQGIAQNTVQTPQLKIVPLLSWYDYSFGEPGERLKAAWVDFRRCSWPAGWQVHDIASAFASMNPPPDTTRAKHSFTITFSHFMPRADLLPPAAIQHFGFLLPILGTASLDTQLRQHQPNLHLYGHSHVNVDKTLNGIRYVNNARGYPSEPRHAARRLLQLY